jgi:hypothetical protein
LFRQSPEHLFEVFLEIREPNDKEGYSILLILHSNFSIFLASEILIKYPTDFSDDVLKSATNFAYPCKIPL